MMRVLVVFTTSFVPYGGLTSVMMNYWRAMDRSNLHFDFACTNDPRQDLLDEIKCAGCKYFKLPKRKHIFSYYRALKNLSKGYDFVHVHGNSSTSVIELFAAKRAGVKKRIVHNHNSITEHPLVNKLLHPFFLRSFTNAVACSEIAGDWLFGVGKFKVLRNAIDVGRFAYDKDSRSRVRESFGICDDKVVIGHVGKFTEQKNYPFIVDVFNEFYKLNSNSMLLLVGGGPLCDSIKSKVKMYGLSKSVIFTGLRTDIPELMNAMDVFLFPSLWEGLPLSVLEAQASGLPTFLSDVVSKEVGLSENVFWRTLDENAEVWARSIFAHIDVNLREKQCRMNVGRLNDAGYNIKLEADNLRRIYFL